MANFELNDYLPNTAESPYPSKVDDLIRARRDKVKELQQFRNVLAMTDPEPVINQNIIDRGRTAGEAVKDIGLSAVQGVDALAKLPAMVYDKATSGNFYGPQTQRISAMSDEREKLKSAFAQANNREISRISQEAGQQALMDAGWGTTGRIAQLGTEFGTAFVESVKRPEMLPDMVAQQLAQLGVMGKVGRGAELLATSAAKAAPKLAATKLGQAALSGSGTTGAVAAGSILQGTDVGSDTMQRLMNAPQQFWDSDPRYQALSQEVGPEAAKQSIASEIASETTLKAAGASILTAALPGGNALERALVKRQLGGLVTIPKAFVGEAAQEGFEEGSGAYLANQGVKEIDLTQKDWEGVGTAAGQGAYMGGILGGGMTAARVASEGALNKVAAAQEKYEAAAAIKEAVDKAAKTGDVSVFLTPDSPVYSPSKALSALNEFNQKDDTDNETRDANVVKGMEILSSMESDLRVLKAQTPQGKQEIQQDLDEVKAKIAQTDPVDTQALEGLSQSATKLEELLATPLAEGVAAKKVAQQIADQVQEINAATELHGKMADHALQKLIESLDLDAELAVADAPVDVNDAPAVEQANAAAQKLITLSMVHRDKVTPEQAAQLANNTSNGLSEAARTYFRAFSEAQQAENAAKDLDLVSKEVLYGDAKKDQMGIQTYRTRLNTALASGSQKVADRTLALLDNFVTSHSGKESFAQEALAKANEEGQRVSVGRTKEGTWEILPVAFQTEKARASNGGFNIDPGKRSLGFIAAIQAEAKALRTAQTELQASYDLKFNPTKAAAPTAPTAPVVATDTAAAPATQSAQPGTTGVGSGVSQTPQVATTSPVTSTATTEEITNGTQTPEAVQTEEKGPQASADTGAAGTAAVTQPDQAVNQPESPQDVNTEENVDQINASEGNVENTEENVQVQPETEAQSEGKLSAFNEPVAEGESFKKRKLIASDLKQSAGGEDVVTPRPLAATKDFLTKWFDKVVDLKQYLGKDWNELGEKQQDLLLAFREKAAKWAPLFQASVGKKEASKSDYYFQDMMQFLIQTTNVGGKDVHALEENVKTAMSYALYSYIAEQASRAAFNGPEEINAILGRDEDHEVTEHEESKLANVGTRRNVVVNSLGQKAVAALGITAQKNANLDTLTRLEGAIGTHIMRVMLANGMLEQTTVDAATMAQLRGTATATNEAKHDFLKLKRNAAGELTNEAKGIYTSVVGTQGILDDLFSVESGLKEPSLQPIQYKQRTTKNTEQGIPTRLAEVMQQKNAEASYVKQDHWILMNNMDETVIHEIAGAKKVSTTKTHKAKRLSIEAKNDGLLREIQRFRDFVEATIEPLGKRINETPMYFEHVVWKQQRVGIATNMVNPQTSKVHRFMLFRKSWETQVDPTDAKQMENFKLRVLEGFGVKTDRMSSEKALKENWSKTQTPVIQAAVQAIIDNTITGVEMTAQMQEDILKGVKEADQNFHSLDALIALARYQHAEGKPFTVHMMGEIDGVTNGPMLTHLLLGAAKTAKDLFARVNKGGFFQKGNPFSQYNIWRGQKGQKDLYESTIEKVVEDINGQISAKPQMTFLWDAVWKFTGDLRLTDDKMLKKRRDIIKTPLTAVMFGSSLSRATESMAEKFVGTIYDSIEKLASMKEGDPATEAERVAIIKQINTLIGTKAPKWRTNLSIQEMLDTEFSTDQLKGIKGAFTYTVGSAVRSTFETEFKDLLERRDQLNRTAQLAFAIYDGAYQALRAEYVKKVMVKGEDTDKNGKPLHDLTAEQEADLRKQLVKMFPTLQTLMSKESKQLGAGLGMMKSKRKLSDKSSYQSEVVLNKLEGLEDASKTAKVNGYELVNEAPGVGMVPMSIHSLDSAISHYAAFMSEVLNVHDAHGTGLGNFFNAARNLNEKTWYALLNYSPAEQMYQALERTVKGFAEILSKEDTPPEVAAAVKQQIQAMMTKAKYKGSAQDFLAEILVQTKMTAYKADTTKLQAMAEMAYVDQYALEGGNYEVTDKDRAEAQAKLDELTSTVSSEVLQMVEQIGKAMDQAATTEFSGDVLAEETIDPDYEDDVAATSPWGELGESTIESDPDVVALMEKTGEVTAAQAIDFLNKKFQSGKQTRMSQFNRRLLSVLTKTVAKDLKIKYVTRETATSEVLQKADFSRGWYVPNGGKSEIYVLSPEHKHSGLTAETLLHELTHAALFHVMDTASTPDVQALVQELKELQTKATEFIKKNGLDQHSAAVSNIHDFVAWGMTNQAFQRDVLGKITMQSKTQQNALITGMKKFIDAVVGLLFSGSNKSSQAIAVNGMTVMINNVSGLFAAANEAQASASTTVLSQAHVDPADRANTYSTEDIYNALDDGSVSAEFGNQLKELLNGIVEKLYGPFGSFKAKLMENSTLDPLEVWAKAVQTGKAPFASQALTAGFQISEQEAFVLEQVEATVRAAMTDNAGQTTAVYSELRKLRAEVARKLKPSDFSDPALYDFLFKVEANGNNESDYLSRFAALGLAHEGVSKLLQFYTDRDTRSLMDVPTALGKLKYLFNKALNLLNGKLTHTREGMQADDKLKTLVEQLVGIEAKKRRKLAQQDSNFLTPLSDLASGMAEGVRGKVAEMAQSDFIKNNRNGFVKLAGAAVTISANSQAGVVMKGLQKMRDEHLKQKNGLLMGLLNDVRGPKAWLEQLLRMRKKQEQDRKFVITETAKAVLDSFSQEEGKELSTDEKAAITSVFLRTGMHSLMEKYEMSEIQELLEDSAARYNAVTHHESELRQFPEFQHYFIHQAKVLAYHRSNGKVRGTMMMMNAGNIAKLYGTKHAGKLSEAEAARAEEIIDRLTTLYAIQYTDGKHLNNAKQVLRNEMNRGDGGNGVEMVLKLHRDLENDARATLFAGNEALMMKGYTPEIYNPHTDVKIVTTPAELKELKRQGYTNEGELRQDSADGVLPGGWVMVLRDGGLQSWQTSVMSFTGQQAKGSKLHSGYTNPFDDAGLQNAETMNDVAQAKEAEIDRMFQPNPGFNPAAEKRNFMAPVMNRDGQISNWRYLMNDKLKDAALERDSRVEQVLGALAGSTFDKQTANEVNIQVVQALKEHYNKEYKYSPKSFVKVSHDSPDAEMRELYAMLPKETREAIKDTWGRDGGMYVPYEMLDMVFGYRKATLSKIWDKEKRNMAENALVWAVETMLYQYARHYKSMSGDAAEEYSKRGAVTMRRAENIWQEVVRETKDTIVVKTGTVLFDNILSNMSLLKIHGVSWKDMAYHHRVAFKAARAYQQDKSRVFQLQQKIDLGLLSPEQEAKAQAEIVELEDAIARNPVLPLINEGLMPTIVEDVAADDDIYSYKSQLARKLSKYESKVNPMVAKVARNVYMAHDTAPYKFLSEATQLSDFVARYTLYQHLISKKDKPLSHRDAVRQASESFINYDVPMHKSMQYLDDMGIVPFMKYALRVQRVLVRLTRDRPLSVLSAVMLNHMFDALPLVTDSGMLSRIGNNPLQWGAFKYPTTLDNLATVNGALSLMK